jgi:hypothetical protein
MKEFSVLVSDKDKVQTLNLRSSVEDWEVFIREVLREAIIYPDELIAVIVKETKVNPSYKKHPSAKLAHSLGPQADKIYKNKEWKR